MELNIYAIFALVATISNTFFALFVYTQNKKELSNRLFALFCLGFSIWTFSYFIWLLQEGVWGALFWSRFLNLGATLIPPLYLHWILSFLNLDKKRKLLIFFAYFITIIFVFLSFSSIYIKEVKPVRDFLYWPQAGLLYTIFLFVSYIGFVGYGFLELVRHYKKVDKERKIQIRYVLIATIIGFGGGATNFPLMYGISLIPPFGIFFVIFHPFFFSYAVLKHHLFNIKVIATELLLALTTVVFLIDLFLSKSFSMVLLKSGILIAILYLGISLIRSVLREIHYREEIAEAYEVEKKAREKLKELDEAKNQFIMATQHHLRTPLTSMIGYLDLIFGGTYGKVSPRIKETLRKFQASTNRLIKVVNEFLDISQFQLGKRVISLQPDISIKSIFEEIVDELQLEAKARGIYLKFQGRGKMPKIKADPGKLKLALYNVVDNGIKYTNKGGVAIKLETKGSKLRIIVKDTGAGISKEDQKTLFTKLFERGKEAKKLHGTGRGIGLYIAFHIIKAHKGKIWAESEGRNKGIGNKSKNQFKLNRGRISVLLLF